MTKDGVTAKGLDKVQRLLEELPVIFPETFAGALDEAGQLIANAAKDTTAFRDRTGNLRNSIQSKMLGNDEVVIWPGMEYGADVELGTQDEGKVGQRIYPKKGNALVWPEADGSGLIFRAWSTIGKREPHPFMAPALEESEDEVLQIFADAIDLTVAKLL